MVSTLTLLKVLPRVFLKVDRMLGFTQYWLLAGVSWFLVSSRFVDALPKLAPRVTVTVSLSFDTTMEL